MKLLLDKLPLGHERIWSQTTQDVDYEFKSDHELGTGITPVTFLISKLKDFSSAYAKTIFSFLSNMNTKRNTM